MYIFKLFDGLIIAIFIFKLTKQEPLKSDEDHESSIAQDHANLTPPADGFCSTPTDQEEPEKDTNDHEVEKGSQEPKLEVDEYEEEYEEYEEEEAHELQISKDSVEKEEDIKEEIVKEEFVIAEKEIPNVDVMAVADDLEDKKSRRVVEEKESPPTAEKLHLDIPEPFVEFEIPETPKEYMPDGVEIREQRPGFQDLGNCKRFWKAQQLMGTRKD